MRIKAKPITIKERHSILFLRRGQLDVRNGAFVMVDKKGVRTHIPVGGITCLMLEPGISITHAAVGLAAEVGCLLVWTGENGARVYASGQPGGARSDKLLLQARLALDNQARLRVVQEMYRRRFGEEPPRHRSILQLQGIEGARVRNIYKLMAAQYGLNWHGRNYDYKDWNKGDLPNRCLSTATHCLYGICEAAILAAGYAPAIGFIHTGKPLSFVYDIADMIKFESVVPIAFKIAARKPEVPTREVRIKCRNYFREKRILKKLIPLIEETLSAGGLPLPDIPPESVLPAIPPEKGIADDGHRN